MDEDRSDLDAVRGFATALVIIVCICLSVLALVGTFVGIRAML